MYVLVYCMSIAKSVIEIHMIKHAQQLRITGDTSKNKKLTHHLLYRVLRKYCPIIFAQVLIVLPEYCPIEMRENLCVPTKYCTITVHFNAYTVFQLWFVDHDISGHIQSSENVLNLRIGKCFSNTDSVKLILKIVKNNDNFMLKCFLEMTSKRNFYAIWRM